MEGLGLNDVPSAVRNPGAKNKGKSWVGQGLTDRHISLIFWCPNLVLFCQ